MLELIPTLSLPFYLVYVVLIFGEEAGLFLASIYFLLLWLSMFNMALAFAMFNRSVGFFGLGSVLIFPLYQGVYLKCARFFHTPRKSFSPAHATTTSCRHAFGV